MKKLSFLLTFLLVMNFAQAQTDGEGIDVSHYEIHVWDFDFANCTLQGETFIDFTTTASINAVVLELKSLTVTDVASDFYGVESFSQEGDFLTVTFDEPIAAGESVTLDVRYGGSTFSGEGIISFSYTDGDGDLGLDERDTLPPFGFNDAHYYNMVVDYLKCVNGEFVKTPLLSWNVQTQTYDTVKFEIRILDRALHESNVIQTEAIITNPMLNK